MPPTWELMMQDLAGSNVRRRDRTLICLRFVAQSSKVAPSLRLRPRLSHILKRVDRSEQRSCPSIVPPAIHLPRTHQLLARPVSRSTSRRSVLLVPLSMRA